MMKREQAEQDLREWAANRDRRDDLVRAAHQAGVTKHRIHTLTGIARTTIDRILENAMTFTSADLRDQVRTYTDASEGSYDVDAIVEEIVERHGAVPVDDIDADEFAEIVLKNATDSR